MTFARRAAAWAAAAVATAGCASFDGTRGAASSTAGPVVAIGGGGDRADIYRRFLELAGGPDAKILVLPLSTGAEKPGEGAAAFFREQGARDVAIWNPADAAEADLPERLAQLDGARGFYFGGGDQARGIAKLRGTRALEAIRRAHASGAVVGGTSAGAAMLSRVMMNGGSAEGALAPGRSTTQEGLGVVDDAVVDQHYLARSRMERLINVLLDHPGLRGVGVDERTAAVFFPDRIEALGEGQVVLIDPPSGVEDRNVDGRRIAAIGRVTLTVLAPGDVAPRRRRG
ncbi:MAG TPA: cyanophycinase [Planctomycetota bacterium]|nr:cyanophycinase [Planctomycetota bacterium]